MKHRNIYNVLVILFVALGSLTYGYGASIIGNVLGQPSFLKYMRLDVLSNSAQLIGAINGLFQAGGFIGTFTSSYLADRLGRKKGILIACAFFILGGALQAGSVAIAMYIVARFITGFGIGMMVTLIPLYQSEISPPQTRGLLVGMHGVFIGIGYGLASWIGVGFYFVNKGGVQWRAPLAIQCLPALLLAIGIMFMPESPRWLMERDFSDKAFEVLLKLHRDPNDSEDLLAKAELTQMQKQLELERHQATGWKALLTIPSNRKRVFIGLITMFGAQCSGTQVINNTFIDSSCPNYGTILYSGLGYGPTNQLLLQAGWISFAPVGNLFTALIVDKVGRVKLLTIGMTGEVIALIGEMVMLALFQNTDNKAGLSAAVFFLFLHVGFYAFFVDASTYVYVSEIFPTHLRAKGMALSTSGLFIAALIFLSSAPTAFAQIGWKYYIVFAVSSSVVVACILLFFPETKGLPLEEVARKFGDRVIAHIDESGHITSEPLFEEEVRDEDQNPPEKYEVTQLEEHSDKV